MKITKFLFVCLDNSVRSQMAEALARKVFGGKAWVQSAGRYETEIHPFTHDVLRELDVEIPHHRSKSLDTIDPASVDVFVCLSQEEVRDPRFLHAEYLHWPVLDPKGLGDTLQERFFYFRFVRDEIYRMLKKLQAASITDSYYRHFC